MKSAQHHSLLEKCKSKLQCDITSHWSEWSTSKSLQIINAGEGVEKREHSYTVGGNVNLCNHNGEQYRGFLKTKNKITIWPNNPTAGHTHQGNKNWKRNMYLSVHCSTVYDS